MSPLINLLYNGILQTLKLLYIILIIILVILVPNPHPTHSKRPKQSSWLHVSHV